MTKIDIAKEFKQTNMNIKKEMDDHIDLCPKIGELEYLIKISNAWVERNVTKTDDIEVAKIDEDASKGLKVIFTMNERIDVSVFDSIVFNKKLFDDYMQAFKKIESKSHTPNESNEIIVDFDDDEKITAIAEKFSNFNDIHSVIKITDFQKNTDDLYNYMKEASENKDGFFTKISENDATELKDKIALVKNSLIEVNELNTTINKTETKKLIEISEKAVGEFEKSKSAENDHGNQGY